MTERSQFRRIVRIPDRLTIERCRRVPELGPRVLFFSGGTALRGVSRVLKTLTHNSTHLMTPFDSGGSSAELRSSFRMPSVGDIRNRLVALADDTVLGNPELYNLITYRLPKDGDQRSALPQLNQMVEGADPLVAAVPDPIRQIARTHLRSFRNRMPEDFDLRGASIGNLMLTGNYLRHERDLESVVLLFSRLLGVLGDVWPTVDADLELCATLADGSRVVGQHLLTGKFGASIDQAITDLALVDPVNTDQQASAQVGERTLRSIRKADLICFPVGSFWTSLVANLLPEGVGRAVAGARAPKVYIPSTGHDPEIVGVPIHRCLDDLLRFLRRDTREETPADQLVNAVILNEDHSVYEHTVDVEEIRARGVEVIETQLVAPTSHPHLDPEMLAKVLVSLA